MSADSYFQQSLRFLISVYSSRGKLRISVHPERLRPPPGCRQIGARQAAKLYASGPRFRAAFNKAVRNGERLIDKMHAELVIKAANDIERAFAAGRHAKRSNAFWDLVNQVRG